MAASIYLDSSVPSYLVAQSSDAITNERVQRIKRFWTEVLPNYEVHISQIVVEEIGGGNNAGATRRLKAVAGIAMLDVDDEVRQAARYYVEQFAMPGRNLRDALHLALASVHDVD